MSKESFKIFVRNNPTLATYVSKGDMTWQQFYEMHNLYGDNNDVWKDYLTVKTEVKTKPSLSSSERAVKELITMVKGVDLETVRHGIEGVQKAISLVQDLGIGSSVAPKQYQARPIYKHFED